MESNLFLPCISQSQVNEYLRRENIYDPSRGKVILVVSQRWRWRAQDGHTHGVFIAEL